jgi:hypothetical protein
MQTQSIITPSNYVFRFLVSTRSWIMMFVFICNKTRNNVQFVSIFDALACVTAVQIACTKKIDFLEQIFSYLSNRVYPFLPLYFYSYFSLASNSTFSAFTLRPSCTFVFIYFSIHIVSLSLVFFTIDIRIITVANFYFIYFSFDIRIIEIAEGASQDYFLCSSELYGKIERAVSDVKEFIYLPFLFLFLFLFIHLFFLILLNSL